MVTEIIRPLNIVVVEDYDVLRDAIVDLLRADGHQVVGVPMAEDVDDVVTHGLPDLYVIDLNLPGEDGFSLAQRIRSGQPDVTIVIASARTDLKDRLTGYDVGADLYLCKPLALAELQAIATQIGRRLGAKPEISKTSAALDPLKFQVKGPAGSVQLMAAEVALLTAFARASQNSLEHWQVSQHLFGDREVTKGNLEVKLGRLRKKLIDSGIDAPAIKALRGHGYKLCFCIVVK